MPSIEALETCLLELDEFWPQKPMRIAYEEMFDAQGPVSAQNLLQRIKSVEYQQPVVLCGPLHVCD
jgi:hypothetical protein